MVHSVDHLNMNETINHSLVVLISHILKKADSFVSMYCSRLLWSGPVPYIYIYMCVCVCVCVCVNIHLWKYNIVLKYS